jgi:hypothetical protein
MGCSATAIDAAAGGLDRQVRTVETNVKSTLARCTLVEVEVEVDVDVHFQLILDSTSLLLYCFLVLYESPL